VAVVEEVAKPENASRWRAGGGAVAGKADEELEEYEEEEEEVAAFADLRSLSVSRDARLVNEGDTPLVVACDAEEGEPLFFASRCSAREEGKERLVGVFTSPEAVDVVAAREVGEIECCCFLV